MDHRSKVLKGPRSPGPVLQGGEFFEDIGRGRCTALDLIDEFQRADGYSQFGIVRAECLLFWQIQYTRYIGRQLPEVCKKAIP